MNAQLPQPRSLRCLLETQNKAALARKLGVEPSTVARWARGEAIPAGDKLQALARELHISADLITFEAA